MDVRVDQAGEDPLSVRIDLPRVARNRHAVARADGGDPAAGDQDDRIGQRSAAVTVDDGAADESGDRGRGLRPHHGARDRGQHGAENQSG